MKAITQHFIGTTEEWKAANPKLYKAVWGFEETKEKKVYAKLGNGIDRWNDLKYFDVENIYGLIEKLTTLKEAIDAEAEERKTADITLQENIGAEAAAREAADIDLKKSIDDEAETRKEADLALSQNIEELKEEDLTLQKNIDAESEEREAADNALREAIAALAPEGLSDLPARLNTLQENIDAEAAARESADNEIKKSIDDETEERKAADITLQENIGAEAAAREDADNDIKKSVDDEAEAREAADLALREAIEEWQGNIQTSITESGDDILEKLFPVGCGYIQGINDPDPIDKGLPGHWDLWTHRAEQYRLTSTALPAFTVYTQGANYTANAYVLWHLPGAGYELFKAKAAVNNAETQLNPVLWEKYVLGDIIDRRFLQGWLDDDFAIGHVIEDGDYAGMRVSEVIALGGTFPSWEGGNRGTFNSGVKPDVIRNITGGTSDNATAASAVARGAFTRIAINDNWGVIAKGATGKGGSIIYDDFNISLIVPTGPENSVRNHPYRFFRRVA